MYIELIKADITDAEEIRRIQALAFAELYERYQDHASSPANETVERVTERFKGIPQDHYILRLNGENIGSVRVAPLPDNVCYLNSICIVPQYRGQGLGKLVMSELEALYPDAKRWELTTINQEKTLCRFYEMLGYTCLGDYRELQEGMMLVKYEKILEKEK